MLSYAHGHRTCQHTHGRELWFALPLPCRTQAGQLGAQRLSESATNRPLCSLHALPLAAFCSGEGNGHCRVQAAAACIQSVLP